MIATSRKTKLTPPELAKQWGIDVQKVLHWVKSGELRASISPPAVTAARALRSTLATWPYSRPGEPSSHRRREYVGDVPTPTSFSFFEV